MSPDIAKLCVESLRAYARDELSCKLKAAHAHEIVAAVFGYKSRVALLSDVARPVSKLQEADFIVLDASTTLLDQRRQSLIDLPRELPESVLIARQVYSVIVGQKWALEKIWPSLTDLAKHLAEEKIKQRMRALGISPSAIHWEVEAELEHTPSEVLARVSIDYRTRIGLLQRDSSYGVRLPRLAANLGYGKPQIEETRYTGEFRNIPATEANLV
jgi:hypothetical protein